MNICIYKTMVGFFPRVIIFYGKTLESIISDNTKTATVNNTYLFITAALAMSTQFYNIGISDYTNKNNNYISDLKNDGIYKQSI